MHLIKFLPRMRDAILTSADETALLQLIKMIVALKHRSDLHVEVRENLSRVRALFKSDQEKARVAQMISQSSTNEENLQ